MLAYQFSLLIFYCNFFASQKINSFHCDWAKPTYNLVKILIYALAMVFMVQYLPSSKAFQGVSIFVGVIFTLGSTSAISNTIAGIVITDMRPFAIGDRVTNRQYHGRRCRKKSFGNAFKNNKERRYYHPECYNY